MSIETIEIDIKVRILKYVINGAEIMNGHIASWGISSEE